MAARNRPGLSENTRLRIKTSMLVKRLEDHAVGKVKMEATQVQAAKILLDRTLPVIRYDHISGSVELNHTFGDVSQTLGFLERNLGIGTDNPSEEPMQDKSLLPPPVRTQ